MTICDIAKLAGVSIATVSRVMNGTGYVKEETRKRVEDVIAEHNYRPNAIARSLIKKETSMIGLIMPGFAEPFQTSIVDGIGNKSDEMNLNLLLHNTGEDLEKEHRSLRMIMEQQIRGLLFVPVIGSDKITSQILEEIEASGVPVVLIDRDVCAGEFDAVFINNKRAIYDGVKALIDNGHGKIGIITCPEVSRDGQTRVEGYLKCLDKYEIIPQDDYIYEGDYTQESGYKACEYFMALPQPPTAVIATNSSETIGCIRYFNENRMAIGKDIALIGFDDIATIGSFGYPVSVIERPIRELGELAFDMLMERIEQPIQKKRSRELILQTRVVLRGSERCETINSN